MCADYSFASLIPQYDVKIAVFAGGIAEASYKDMPPGILRQVRKRLARDYWGKGLQFYRRYGIPGIFKRVDVRQRR